MEGLDAIILAGGMGTRLSQVVRDRQKVIAMVNGRPFLDIILESLRNKGIARVVFAVGHKADQVRGLYGGEHDLPFDIHFSVEADPLGTGGAIKKALSLTTTPDVLALNGDSYTDFNLDKMMEIHYKKRALLTMAVVPVDNADRFGRVTFDDYGRVLSFEEKKSDGEGGYINAGIYLMNRKIFDGVDPGVFISLEKDVLPGLLPQGIYAMRTEGVFIDIGTPESYSAANEIFKGK